MQWLRSRSGLGHWVRRLAVLAVLVVAATVAAVWFAGPSDRDVFCAKAIAIHSLPGQSGFPDYRPLVDLARDSLSPPDALRIMAAVEESENTRTDFPSFDGIRFSTAEVAGQLRQLCPDHEVYAIVAVS